MRQAGPIVALLLANVATMPQAAADEHPPRAAATRRGLPGPRRVVAAEPAEQGRYGLSLTLDTFFQRGLVVPEDEVAHVAGVLALRYAVRPWLQVAAGYRARSTATSEHDPTLLHAIGDTEVLVRGVWPLVDDRLAAGLVTGVQLFARESQASVAWPATSVPLLATLTGQPPLGWPLVAHLMLGAVWDNSAEAVGPDLDRTQRFALGVRDDPYWTLGLALEVALTRARPFLEYTTEQALSGEVRFADNPGRVTLGVQLPARDGWGVSLGLDLGMGGARPRLEVPATPSHTLFVQVAFEGRPVAEDDAGGAP